MLLCGDPTSRTLTHNMNELRKKTYKHVGTMMALSIIHGGPAPAFFSIAVADYIVYGTEKVKAGIHKAEATTLATPAMAGDKFWHVETRSQADHPLGTSLPGARVKTTWTKMAVALVSVSTTSSSALPRSGVARYQGRVARYHY